MRRQKLSSRTQLMLGKIIPWIIKAAEKKARHEYPLNSNQQLLFPEDTACWEKEAEENAMKNQYPLPNPQSPETAPKLSFAKTLPNLWQTETLPKENLKSTIPTANYDFFLSDSRLLLPNHLLQTICCSHIIPYSDFSPDFGFPLFFPIVTHRSRPIFPQMSPLDRTLFLSSKGFLVFGSSLDYAFPKMNFYLRKQSHLQSTPQNAKNPPVVLESRNSASLYLSRNYLYACFDGICRTYELFSNRSNKPLTFLFQEKFRLKQAVFVSTAENCHFLYGYELDQLVHDLGKKSQISSTLICTKLEPTILYLKTKIHIKRIEKSETPMNLTVYGISDSKILIIYNNRENCFLYIHQVLTKEILLKHTLSHTITAIPASVGSKKIKIFILDRKDCFLFIISFKHFFCLVRWTFPDPSSSQPRLSQAVENSIKITQRRKFKGEIIFVDQYKEDWLWIIERSDNSIRLMIVLIKGLIEERYIHLTKILKTEFHINLTKEEELNFLGEPVEEKATFSLLATEESEDDRLLYLLMTNEVRIFQVKKWWTLVIELIPAESLLGLKLLVLLNRGSKFLNLGAGKIAEMKVSGSGKSSGSDEVGLEWMFVSNTAEKLPDDEKQLLLEYYWLTGQFPNFVHSWLKENPELLLPLILTHRIDNIPEECKEQQVKYWSQKNLSVVEQLVVAGSLAGWDLAVSNGWTRAMHAMILKGADIGLVIGKLYALMDLEISKLSKLQSPDSLPVFSRGGEVTRESLGLSTFSSRSSLSETPELSRSHSSTPLTLSILLENFRPAPFPASKGPGILGNNVEEEKKEKIYQHISQSKFYAHQIAVYVPIALSIITGAEQLNDLCLILFSKDVWPLLLQLNPTESLNLLPSILSHQSIIDSFHILDYLHMHQEYPHLCSRSNSISLSILSYTSILYTNIYASDQSAQFQLLLLHAKLIDKFQFQQTYLADMLALLADSANLLQNYVGPSPQPEFFLASLWEHYLSRIKKTEVKPTQTNSSKNGLFLKDNPDLSENESDDTNCYLNKIREIRAACDKVWSETKYLCALIASALPIEEAVGQVLKYYLGCQHHQLRMKVFEYLEQNLMSSKNLRIDALSNIKALLHLDRKRTRQLLLSSFEDCEEVVNQIEGEPVLQLEYLELLFKESEIHSEKNDLEERLDSFVKKYFMKYIKLLLLLSADRVLPLLERAIASGSQGPIYDPTQIIKFISLEVKSPSPLHREITAFLCSKLGETERAIDQYRQILKLRLEQLLEIENESPEIFSPLRNSTTDSSSLLSLRNSTADQTSLLPLPNGSGTVSSHSTNPTDLQLKNPPESPGRTLLKKEFSSLDNYFKTRESTTRQKEVFNLELQEFKKIHARMIECSLSAHLIENHIKWSLDVTLEFLQDIISLKHLSTTTACLKLVKECYGEQILLLLRKGLGWILIPWLLQQKITYFDFISRHLRDGCSDLAQQIILLEKLVIYTNQTLIKEIHGSIKILSKSISVMDTECELCRIRPNKTIKADSNADDIKLIFPCGHLYHADCIKPDPETDQDSCLICVEKDMYRTMIHDNSFNLNFAIQQLIAARQPKPSPLPSTNLLENPLSLQSLKKLHSDSLPDSEIQPNDRVLPSRKDKKSRKLEAKKEKRFLLYDQIVNRNSNETEIMELTLQLKDFYSSSSQ